MTEGHAIEKAIQELTHVVENLTRVMEAGIAVILLDRGRARATPEEMEEAFVQAEKFMNWMDT
jgi:hypothetical protein